MTCERSKIVGCTLVISRLFSVGMVGVLFRGGGGEWAGKEGLIEKGISGGSAERKNH